MMSKNQIGLLHILPLVFAYNAMLHSVTGYQQYEIMFCCKVPVVCDTWLRLTSIQKHVCMGEQTV